MIDLLQLRSMVPRHPHPRKAPAVLSGPDTWPDWIDEQPWETTYKTKIGTLAGGVASAASYGRSEREKGNDSHDRHDPPALVRTALAAAARLTAGGTAFGIGDDPPRGEPFRTSVASMVAAEDAGMDGVLCADATDWYVPGSV